MRQQNPLLMTHSSFKILSLVVHPVHPTEENMCPIFAKYALGALYDYPPHSLDAHGRLVFGKGSPRVECAYYTGGWYIALRRETASPKPLEVPRCL